MKFGAATTSAVGGAVVVRVAGRTASLRDLLRRVGSSLRRRVARYDVPEAAAGGFEQAGSRSSKADSPSFSVPTDSRFDANSVCFALFSQRRERRREWPQASAVNQRFQPT
jgi:hypothetical protein